MTQQQTRRTPAKQDRAQQAAIMKKPKNNPLDTPALQSHLRALKRAEYQTKTREELSPTHTFPPHLNHISRIGEAGHDHINTARWTKDDLSSVFSLSNSLPFHFDLLDIKITSLFHLYAFLFNGGRQATNLLARDTSSLDEIVHGKPIPMVNRFAIFALAVYQKVTQLESLEEITKSTEAAFDYYIITNESRPGTPVVRRRVYESGIISAVFEEVRIAVKRGNFLNITPFFDLDYQIQLEEIKDPEQRYNKAIEFISEVCDPIREKVKKVEANMKATSMKKSPTNVKLLSNKPWFMDYGDMPQPMNVKEVAEQPLRTDNAARGMTTSVAIEDELAYQVNTQISTPDALSSGGVAMDFDSLSTPTTEQEYAANTKVLFGVDNTNPCVKVEMNQSGKVIADVYRPVLSVEVDDSGKVIDVCRKVQKVNVEIDDSDSDPLGTFELIKSEVLSQRSSIPAASVEQAQAIDQTITESKPETGDDPAERVIVM